MRNLILHPITHEVFEIEDDSLFHNFGHCVEMPFKDFEELANAGSCSAERLIDYANKTLGVFHFSQVTFVKISSLPVRYAWASRIKVPCRVLGINDANMGSEFLWIWPASAAINAFINYKERNRLSLTSTTILDIYEPSISHSTSTPGSQIGPGDIENAKPVPFGELTPEQRFFISCIKPQRTQFQRRKITDKWPTAMQRADTAAISAYTKDQPATQVFERRRELQYWCVEQSPIKRTAKEICHERWFTNRTTVAFTGCDFQALPDEITMRILCMGLATAMTEDTDTAASTISTFRAVSRHFRNVTDGFVGTTLDNLHVHTKKILQKDCKLSPHTIGSRTRCLGLTPRLAMEIPQHGHMKLRQASLDLFPAYKKDTVPSWQTYIRCRSIWDKRVVKNNALVATKQVPSQVYRNIIEDMDKFADRDVALEETRAYANPMFDIAISRGSVAQDLANSLVECVGV